MYQIKIYKTINKDNKPTTPDMSGNIFYKEKEKLKTLKKKKPHGGKGLPNLCCWDQDEIESLC
jgi:hypothetical protein